MSPHEIEGPQYFELVKSPTAEDATPRWAGTPIAGLPPVQWDSVIIPTPTESEGFYFVPRQEVDPLLAYRASVSSAPAPKVSRRSSLSAGIRSKRHKDFSRCCGRGCCCCCLYSFRAKIIASLLTVIFLAGIGVMLGLLWPRIAASWDRSGLKGQILKSGTHTTLTYRTRTRTTATTTTTVPTLYPTETVDGFDSSLTETLSISPTFWTETTVDLEPTVSPK